MAPAFSGLQQVTRVPKQVSYQPCKNSSHCAVFEPHQMFKHLEQLKQIDLGKKKEKNNFVAGLAAKLAP